LIFWLDLWCNSRIVDGNMSFFEHRKCKSYPCHELKKINCIFCYCPLYMYNDCGGNHTETDKGIKDCSICLLPHRKEGYKYVNAFLKEKNNEQKSNICRYV